MNFVINEIELLKLEVLLVKMI